MKDIKRTQSYANVAKEIENRGKNMLLLNCFAERAREQGYFSVGAKFDSIVRQEREHCRSLYRIMEDGNDIDTLANLIYCAGELHRSADRLRDAFGKTASEEGFSYLANVINEIAKVDSRTEEEIKCIMSDLKVGKLYSSDTATRWQCIKCGCGNESESAPEICPLCGSQKGFFIRR
jgi:rubrerythrin